MPAKNIQSMWANFLFDGSNLKPQSILASILFICSCLALTSYVFILKNLHIRLFFSDLQLHLRVDKMLKHRGKKRKEKEAKT